MRRLRGRSRDSKSATKFRTEAMELRSSSITTISVSGNSETILSFASSAAFTFLAGKINLAPRFANTLAVSAPIPDVAPITKSTSSQNLPTFRFTGKRKNNSPVIITVTERRSQFSVTSSAVDLEPKPLAPAAPRRYFPVSIIGVCSVTGDCYVSEESFSFRINMKKIKATKIKQKKKKEENK